jgi:hypothetical protein
MWGISVGVANFLMTIDARGSRCQLVCFAKKRSWRGNFLPHHGSVMPGQQCGRDNREKQQQDNSM